MDANVLLIGGSVLILIVLLTISWGGKCNCSEGYSNSPAAKFPVKRPKYMVEQTHPIKKPMSKEGFIIPIPTKAQMLKSDALHGGTIGPTANPFLGGISGEATYGVSVPGSNTETLTSGNGSGDIAVMKVWKTVI